MKIFLFILSSMLAFWGFKINEKSAQTCNTCDSLTGVEKVVCLADAFKATLTASQITTLEPARTLTNAAKWSNLPVGMGGRLGLRFADLNATQLAAAKAVIQAATGTTANEGYQEMVGLWAADQYLAENGGGSGYGEGLYYIAFLGGASLTGTWELQAGGHHIALANTYSAGVLSGATPSFRGIEPFAAFSQDGNTYQPLVQERDSLAAMLTALSSTELTAAKLSGTFNDLVLGPNKDWQFPTTKSGIKVSALSTAKKALVLAAIKTYVKDIDDENAAAIIALYTAGLDDTYVAFSGNTSLLNQNDYVRIDGPRVWIEYSTQNGIILNPKHPHSVWRDHISDYGGLGNPASGTSSVHTFQGRFEIAPNPASALAQVTVEMPTAGTVSLKLFDLMGKQLPFSSKINASAGLHQVSLDIHDLPAGAYNCILEVKGQNAATEFATRPLIKI